MHKLFDFLPQIILFCMKTTQFILILTTVLCVACTESEKNQNKSTSDKVENTADTTSQTAAEPLKIVKRHFPLSADFYQITNISSATVEYTTGEYSVWAEGDSASLANLQVDIDGGVLTIMTPLDANDYLLSYPSATGIKVHVSAPEMKTVALCAGGGFVCHGKLSTEFLQLGGVIGGQMDIDSVECDRFRYDSNGATVININDVKCQECVIVSGGEGTINMGINASKSAYVDLKGSTVCNSTLHSPDIEVSVGSQGAVNLKVDTENFKMNALSGIVNVSGKARRKDIKKTSTAVVNSSL